MLIVLLAGDCDNSKLRFCRLALKEKGMFDCRPALDQDLLDAINWVAERSSQQVQAVACFSHSSFVFVCVSGRD